MSSMLVIPKVFLVEKLNFLKLKLKELNKDVFGHLESKLTPLVEKLKNLDDKEEQLTITHTDRILV